MPAVGRVTESIRAAELRGPSDIGLVETSLADPGPGEVRVAVAACGICGSNLHAWRRPELGVGANGPGVPGAGGHEVAGVVTGLGPDVRGVGIGRRVCVEPNLAVGCASCAACLDGDAWYCRQRRQLPVWGLADAMLVGQAAARPLPDGLTFEVASLVEPLAAIVHAYRRSWTVTRRGGRLTDARVLVLGAGVTGLLAVAAARYLGATEVSALASYPHQADRVRLLGADAVMLTDAPERQLRSRRADLVVEAVGGTADTFELALAVAPRGAEVVCVGLFDEPRSLDVRRAVLRETRVLFSASYGSLDGVADFTVAAELLDSGMAGLDGLITHRFDLGEVSRAFDVAADKRSGALRVVVCPGGAKALDAARSA